MKKLLVGFAGFAGFLFLISQSHAADIIWVHQNRGGAGALEWEDDQWRALVEGQGHTIIAHDRYDNLETLALEDYDAIMAEFNAADLVVFSRDSGSGDYNDPIEHTAWTSDFSTPLLLMSPYLLRNNRWGMVDNSSIVDAASPMLATVPDHPIFDGIELSADDDVEFWSQLGDDDNIDLLGTTDFGFAQVIAEEADSGNPWIAYWDGESEDGDFYDGSFTFAGGPRLFLSAGSDDDPNTWGEKNITEAGDQIFLNAIAFLTGDPGNPVVDPMTCEPGTGDFDGSGTVDFPDFLTLSGNFNTAAGAESGDIDCSGMVDFADFLELSKNFGKDVSSLASVPEPQPVLPFAISMVAVACGRRRRNR